MRNRMMTSALAVTGIVAASAAQAQDDVTLQLKWVTQAQFAGYFAALENGYYEEEDLNVTIRPGGPDIAPPQVVAGGEADVVVEWMPAALAARESGLELVNIAQPFKRSGMMLTCLEESGIESPDDFRGRTLGVWFAGNEFPFLSWMSSLDIGTEGGEDGVEVLRQGFNVDPLLQGQADCISTMTYNEYWQVIDAGIEEDQLINFHYEDQGVATLEDGLWVEASRLEDEEFVDAMARFVRASMRGWDWAADNIEEAAGIVLAYDETGAQEEHHQIRMMDEIAELLDREEGGVLDPDDYERTVETLLAGGSDPVITEHPGDAAWTHEVTDHAAD